MSDWANQTIHLHITNKGEDLLNKRVINEMSSKVCLIRALDGAKEEATKRCRMPNVGENCPIYESGNLPGILRICVGTRFVYI